MAVYGLVYSIYYLRTFADTSAIPFFDVHGFWFFVGLVLAPRITLLVSSLFFNLVTAGTFWWIAWFISPRFLVAGMASAYYWDTNPVLVVFAWIAAVGSGGSSSSSSNKRAA